VRNFRHTARPDGMMLRALARSPKAGSYPELRAWHASIAAAYNNYMIKGGCANSLTPVALSHELGKRLIAHYSHPPKSHKFITSFREETGAHTCTMCGSASCGTLDHVLPKEIFPEFSLYSRNLVPACQCNSKRGIQYKGADGARILHPYFDSVLSQRLVGCDFEDHGRAPSLKIVNLLEVTHPQYSSVQFHIENVLLKTQIKRALRRDWAKLLRKPSLVVRELRRTPRNRNQLTEILKTELSILDDSYESYNNWASIFITGLLQAHTLQWIYEHLSQPGRMADGPLL